MLRDLLLGVGITLIIIALTLIFINDRSFLTEDRLIENESTQNRSTQDKVIQNKLTEAELISRAKEIGMSFSNTAEISLDEKTSLTPPSKVPSIISVKIPAGISSHEVANLLLEKKLIKDKESFMKLLAKFDLEDKIMAGDYEFKSNISSLKLLLLLTTS